MLPALVFTENETISDFEIQDLAAVGPGDRSGMLFGLTRDGFERFRTPFNRIPDEVLILRRERCLESPTLPISKHDQLQDTE